jgi:hypothetical protein
MLENPLVYWLQFHWQWHGFRAKASEGKLYYQSYSCPEQWHLNIIPRNCPDCQVHPLTSNKISHHPNSPHVDIAEYNSLHNHLRIQFYCLLFKRPPGYQQDWAPTSWSFLHLVQCKFAVSWLHLGQPLSASPNDSASYLEQPWM